MIIIICFIVRMLEQLHQIQIKKMKKKLIKEKLKYCLTMSHELEEYLSQQWSSFMLEKSDLLITRGINMSSSLTNEFTQFFNEIVEQTKVIFIYSPYLLFVSYNYDYNYDDN